jgi:hypothetical protein
MKHCRPLQSLLILLCVAVPLTGLPQSAERLKTENVLLITLDGVRPEEMFAGLDLEVLREHSKKEPLEETDLYKKYWAPSPEERREKLFPFFWGVLMKDHGSILGNPAKQSMVELKNRHRFSYPGYSEILTGQAKDQIIKSNDKIQNPTPTFLEFLKEKKNLNQNQVAAFASWDTMKFIVESEAGAIASNAGFEPYNHPDPEIQLLNQLQMETSTPWDSVRHDAYTFRFALAHLRTYQPRALFLGLGETDDWAHDGRYDRVLFAAELADNYLRQLWTFLQDHPQYRNKTTILITTDHGRGNNQYNWRHHGANIEGAQYIWLAVISPDHPKRGEWSDTETVYANQIAATLCRFMGLDYSAEFPAAGKPIPFLNQ